MSRRDGFALHHSFIEELAVAIKVSSRLPDRDAHSATLLDLAHGSRDLGDQLDAINSEAYSVFSWAVLGVSRIHVQIVSPVSA